MDIFFSVEESIFGFPGKGQARVIWGRLCSGEEATLYGLAQSLGMKVDKDKLNDPHTKAQLLLNAHFTRSPITTDLSSDQKFILEHSVRLLQGLVDVISSCGWLTPALSAMELSQMVVQATTSTSSPLMQLPHFTPAMVEKAKSLGRTNR